MSKPNAFDREMARHIRALHAKLPECDRHAIEAWQLHEPAELRAAVAEGDRHAAFILRAYRLGRTTPYQYAMIAWLAKEGDKLGTIAFEALKRANRESNLNRRLSRYAA